MSIKPILFNTEMVRALLEGRKTVTRRVMKPQPKGDGSTPEPLSTRPGYWNAWGDDCVYRQPYLPGDILRVRETWQFIPCIDCRLYENGRCNDLPVTYDDGDSIGEGCFVYRADYPETDRISWRPSIHMPREAARIFLRVTDVRVERLQAITAEGALDEGANVKFPEPKPSYISLAYTEMRLKPAARQSFVNIWDSTIKSADKRIYGWEANPWVWVIEFERCEKPKEWGNV